jgi:hypothetical protein
MLAGSAAALTAQSSNRLLGANDRIRLSVFGCGARSQGLVHMTELAARRTPVEIVAVCDLWSLARERRAAQVEKAFGRAAKTQPERHVGIYPSSGRAHRLAGMSGRDHCFGKVGGAADASGRGARQGTGRAGVRGP